MRRIIVVLAILGAIWTVVSSVTLVQPGELAVVRRFGRVLDNHSEPGLLLTFPWGIDRVDRVKVGIERTINVGFTGKEGDDPEGNVALGQLLTGDHNLVNVKAEIRFRVLDKEVEKFVLTGERQVESLIARAAEASLAEWLAGNRVDRAILQGKHLLPVWLTARLKDRIQPYELGVQIEGVSIPLVSPPSEVKGDFDAVGQEQTNIKTKIYKADEDRKRILSDAEAEKYRIGKQNLADIRDMESAARADAEVFVQKLKEYRRLTRANPDYINVLWLDDMTRLYERIRQAGRLDLLDRHLGGDGLNIMQFPLPSRKK